MDLNNISFISDPWSAKQGESDKSVLGKNDFLRLLVTKMSYQDPLNPVKDEDFVSQLAQFSSLEQLENMNSNLTNDLQWNYLLSQTISNTMATSLIGRTIRADASQVYLETAGSSDLAINVDRPASEITIKISDENGNVVRTITKRSVEQGDMTINWDGTDDSGVQVASGVYNVEVSGLDHSGNSFSPDSFIEGKVSSVKYVDGMAMLIINGQKIPLSSVHEVRES